MIFISIVVSGLFAFSIIQIGKEICELQEHIRKLSFFNFQASIRISALERQLEDFLVEGEKHRELIN